MFAFNHPAGLGVFALGLWLLPCGSARANEELYGKVASSTVLVYKSGGPLDGCSGTGFVVDLSERLLITARHVVENTNGGTASVIDVVFAQSRDGAIITDSFYYRQNRHKLAVRAKVVYDSTRADLAVLQVEKLPAGIKALPLAARTARPGQLVHVVGHSGERFGAVFSYAQGYVRNVFHWNEMGARVVATQVPTNKGDSGGPTVNNAGAVVGFCSMSTSGEPVAKTSVFHDLQVTELSVCVSEIRDALRVLRNQALASRTPAFQGEFKVGIHAVKLEKDVMVRIAVKAAGFVPDVRIDNNLVTPITASAQGAAHEIQVLFTPKETKEYRIQVCPYPGRDVAAGPRPYSLSVDRLAFAAEATVQEKRLQLNESVKKFEAGKAYRISVKCKGFEADVHVLQDGKTVMRQFSNGKRVSSPAGQGILEALGLASAAFETDFLFVPGQSADYRILVLVSPFSPPTRGPREYTVHIGEQKLAFSVRDQLTAKDPLYPQAGAFKTYTVRLEAGKSYQIDLLTTEFDSDLQLDDANGNKLAKGFDAEGLNTRLFFHATRTGSYRLAAMARSRDATGAFTLTVAPSPDVLAAPAASFKVPLKK